MTQLRISAIVKVPDDIWGQTKILAAAEPIVGEFRAALEKIGGRVEAELVRAWPRAAKPTAEEPAVPAEPIAETPAVPVRLGKRHGAAA